jgi:hypothetical protein
LVGLALCANILLIFAIFVYSLLYCKHSSGLTVLCTNIFVLGHAPAPDSMSAKSAAPTTDKTSTKLVFIFSLYSSTDFVD